MYELPGVSDFLARVWNLLSAMWMSLAAPAMMSPGHWIPAVQTLVVAGFKFVSWKTKVCDLPEVQKPLAMDSGRICGYVSLFVNTRTSLEQIWLGCKMQATSWTNFWLNLLGILWGQICIGGEKVWNKFVDFGWRNLKLKP